MSGILPVLIRSFNEVDASYRIEAAHKKTTKLIFEKWQNNQKWKKAVNIQF